MARQRLEVFGQAVEAAVIDDLVLPEGRAYLRDQLRRAANSIALNIAEGAGVRPGEKARFYRMAKWSATGPDPGLPAPRWVSCSA